MESLLEELEKKKVDCDLAANIGQVLLLENERLMVELATLKAEQSSSLQQGKDKEYVSRTNYSPNEYISKNNKSGKKLSDNGIYNSTESASMVEFADEIQKSLLAQTRQLSQKLEEEYNLRILKEEIIQQKSMELDKSVNRYKQLKCKNESLREQIWSLQSKNDDYEKNLYDLNIQISKLSKQIKASPKTSIDSTYLDPEFYTHPVSALSVIEIRSMSPVSSIRSSVQEEEKTHLELMEARQKCEELQNENIELRDLLDKSYNNIEMIQNESLLNYQPEILNLKNSILHEIGPSFMDEPHAPESYSLKQIQKEDGSDNPFILDYHNDHSKELLSICEAVGADVEGISFNFDEAPLNSTFDFDQYDMEDMEEKLSEVTEDNEKSNLVLLKDVTIDEANLPILNDSPVLKAPQNLADEDDTPRYSRFRMSTQSSLGMNLNINEGTIPKSKLAENSDLVEALTYTMIGSWYNRHNKKPQLRYMWTNPYKRLINWSDKPPSETSDKYKSAYFSAIQWRDPPKTKQNYPPKEPNSIYLATKARILKITPISWEIHNNWIDGIIFLLNRTNINTAPLLEQMMPDLQEESDEDSTIDIEPSFETGKDRVELLTGSDKSSTHRRVHTMISYNPTNSSKMTTPMKNQHHKRTVATPSTELSDIQSSSRKERFVNSIMSITPRKLSEKFKKSREENE